MEQGKEAIDAARDGNLGEAAAKAGEAAGKVGAGLARAKDLHGNARAQRKSR